MAVLRTFRVRVKKQVARGLFPPAAALRGGARTLSHLDGSNSKIPSCAFVCVWAGGWVADVGDHLSFQRNQTFFCRVVHPSIKTRLLWFTVTPISGGETVAQRGIQARVRGRPSTQGSHGRLPSGAWAPASARSKNPGAAAPGSRGPWVPESRAQTAISASSPCLALQSCGLHAPRERRGRGAGPPCCCFSGAPPLRGARTTRPEGPPPPPPLPARPPLCIQHPGFPAGSAPRPRLRSHFGLGSAPLPPPLPPFMAPPDSAPAPRARAQPRRAMPESGAPRPAPRRRPPAPASPRSPGRSLRRPQWP